LQLQRAGVVSAREARFYLRELAAMDRHAGRGAFPTLARMAQRAAATRRGARARRDEGPDRGRPIRLVYVPVTLPAETTPGAPPDGCRALSRESQVTGGPGDCRYARAELSGASGKNLPDFQPRRGGS